MIANEIIGAIDAVKKSMTARRLPKFPEPLTKDEQRAIHENQTAILEWLKSRGHKVEDGPEAGRIPEGKRPR